MAPIPATIVEKNNMKLNIRDLVRLSLLHLFCFISDITSIHYKDGIVADYTLQGKLKQITA